MDAPENRDQGATPGRGITRRQAVARSGYLAAGALATSALAACGGGDESEGGGEQGDFTFYSVTHGAPGDPFWAVYRKGVKDAQKMLEVKVEDLAPSKFSVAALVDLMNSAIAAKPDGIIATITDPQALDRPLRGAIDRGIPVIAIDTPDFRPEGKRIPYLFYIGGDEHLGGIRAAERLLEERKPKRAGCAIQEVGNVSLEARCKGFAATLGKVGAPVDEIPIEGGDPTRSAEILRDYFKSHDDADALLTLGPQGASPAIQVLKEENLEDKVTHSTFDLTLEQVEQIKAGTILSTISTQQYLIGRMAVELNLLHKQHGFTLASDMLTGPFVIDKSNIAEVERNVEDGFS
jgi:simple sugar transport system substrate-binding protein